MITITIQIFLGIHYQLTQPRSRINSSWINHRNTRQTTDPHRIRIPHKYKKGNCLFNLIDTWNKSSNDHKIAGNEWSLKNMIKSDILEKLPVCKQKNCEICKSDAKRDLTRYMYA